jgi:hypothetical protein
MSQPDVSLELAVLRKHLEGITDPRFARGKVHPLAGVLGLVVLALMAGARSMSEISRFGKLNDEVLGPLGLRRSPSVATLSRLLRLVSVDGVRRSLLAFVRELHALRQGEGSPVGVVAMDGKSLRGSWEGGRQLHLLHLFAHQGALALDQVVVGDGAGEVIGAQRWVEVMADEFPGLGLLTGDAQFADRKLAKVIVDSGRDYLLKVKKTSRTSTTT